MSETPEASATPEAAPKKHLVLTVFMLVAGYYQDSWRMEGSRSEELTELDLVTELTQMCERAKLDAVFFGDVVSAKTIIQGNVMTSGIYEPITTLSALAARTSKIGLIGTSSTSFSNPFVLARQMAGIDSLSGGRAGWNIVTSWMGGENFGYDQMPAAVDRYRRATEFVSVTNALWDSWSDDAVINNRETGWWADPEKIQAIDHEGEFFKVKGPLNMRRSPQGRPVMVQAGSSGPGMELGATYADAIYTQQPEKEGAKKFTQEMKALAASKGRDPESIKVLAGILPVVGRTEEEAQEIADRLEAHVNFDRARLEFAENHGIDIDDVGLDEVIPLDRLEGTPGSVEPGGSNQREKLIGFVRQGHTLRQLILNAMRSGHQWAVGTPEKIADLMIDWLESGACDGFSLNPPFMPGGLKNICELLIPELQRRGYYRTEYTGSTLREHLGLDRPGAWDTRA